MSVHQCPRCELRFPDKPEVLAHLVDDHDVDEENLEPYRAAMHADVHPRRRAPDVTHSTR